jgi:hypothetical protein
MTWYEILIAVIIGLLIGGLICYLLYYPIYEAFRDFEDAYTKECKAIIECYDKIIDFQKTISETLKIQEETGEKIKETLEKIK